LTNSAYGCTGNGFLKITTLFQLTNGFQNRRSTPLNGYLPLAQSALMIYICYKCYYAMKVIYKVTSDATGIVLIKRRKIAKALRWWLRENGFEFKYNYYFGYVH